MELKEAIAEINQRVIDYYNTHDDLNPDDDDALYLVLSAARRQEERERRTCNNCNNKDHKWGSEPCHYCTHKVRDNWTPMEEET